VIYKLRCPNCLEADDYNLAMDDVDAVVPCEFCGMDVSRKTDRVWEPTFQIQGDTVPRGCSYDYWDENLGVRVKSKGHRIDEMKRQGLREYAPDPEMQKYRDEARYIKSHAAANDRDAAAAARKLSKEAGSVRRRNNIKAAMAKIPDPAINID
jgi:hypothetical protein